MRIYIVYFRCNTDYKDRSVFNAVLGIFKWQRKRKHSVASISTARQRYVLYRFYLKLFIVVNVANEHIQQITEQAIKQTIISDVIMYSQARELSVVLLNSIKFSSDDYKNYRLSDISSEPEVERIAEEILRHLLPPTRKILYNVLANCMMYPVLMNIAEKPKEIACLIFAMVHYDYYSRKLNDCDNLFKAPFEPMSVLLNCCDKYLLAPYEPLVRATLAAIELMLEQVTEFQTLRYDRLINCIMKLASPTSAPNIRLAVCNFLVNNTFLYAVENCKIKGR